MKLAEGLNHLILLTVSSMIITFNTYLIRDACSNEQIHKINTSLSPVDLLTNLKIFSLANDNDDIVNLTQKYLHIPESFWKNDQPEGVEQLAFAKYYNRQIDESMPYRINIYKKKNTTKRQMVIGIYKESNYIINPIMVVDVFGQPSKIFTRKPSRDQSRPTLIYRYEERNNSNIIFPYGFEFTFINPNENILYKKNIENIDIESELQKRLDFNNHKEYNCSFMAFGNINNPILYGD